MTIDIQAMKAAVGYDPDSEGRSAFASKWADKLDPDTVELVEAFAADRITRGFGKKGAASYKSLILRYLATGEFSKGKSGNSQKSAVTEFIRYCDRLEAEAEELDETDEVDETEELEEELS